MICDLCGTDISNGHHALPTSDAPLRACYACAVAWRKVDAEQASEFPVRLVMSRPDRPCTLAHALLNCELATVTEQEYTTNSHVRFRAVTEKGRVLVGTVDAMREFRGHARPAFTEPRAGGVPREVRVVAMLPHGHEIAHVHATTWTPLDADFCTDLVAARVRTVKQMIVGPQALPAAAVEELALAVEAWLTRHYRPFGARDAVLLVARSVAWASAPEVAALLEKPYSVSAGRWVLSAN